MLSQFDALSHSILLYWRTNADIGVGFLAWLTLTILNEMCTNVNFANWFSVLAFVREDLKPFLVFCLAYKLCHFYFCHSDELYVVRIQFTSKLDLDIDFFFGVLKFVGIQILSINFKFIWCILALSYALFIFDRNTLQTEGNVVFLIIGHIQSKLFLLTVIKIGLQRLWILFLAALIVFSYDCYLSVFEYSFVSFLWNQSSIVFAFQMSPGTMKFQIDLKHFVELFLVLEILMELLVDWVLIHDDVIDFDVENTF